MGGWTGSTTAAETTDYQVLRTSSDSQMTTAAEYHGPFPTPKVSNRVGMRLKMSHPEEDCVLECYDHQHRRRAKLATLLLKWGSGSQGIDWAAGNVVSKAWSIAWVIDLILPASWRVEFEMMHRGRIL